MRWPNSGASKSASGCALLPPGQTAALLRSPQACCSSTTVVVSGCEILVHGYLPPACSASNLHCLVHQLDFDLHLSTQQVMPVHTIMVLTDPGLPPAAAGFGAAWQSLPVSVAMQHLLPHALSMGMHAAGPYAQALHYYAHQQQAQQQQAAEQDRGQGEGPDQDPAVSGQAQPAQAALLEAAHSAQGPGGGSMQEPLASQDTAAARGGQGALDLLAELAGREMAEMQQESGGARVGSPNS